MAVRSILPKRRRLALSRAMAAVGVAVAGVVVAAVVAARPVEPLGP